MRIPFFGPNYVSRAQIASQTCINLYFEKNEGGSGEEGAYIGTPGTKVAFGANNTDIQGPVRGMLEANNSLYIVSGPYLSSVTDVEFSSPTTISTITDGLGPVSMADNGLQLAVAHSAGISVLDYATSVLTLVPDSPVNSIIGYLDSYIVGTDEKGKFVWSDIGNAAVFGGLSFASAEGSPDDLVSLIVDHRELWLFGKYTTEVWGTTGNSEEPFSRTGNAFLEHGCMAKFSPAKINNTVIWLGRDANGAGIVFQANGYSPQRISTHGLEYELSTYATLEDAIGMTYQIEGHAFYVLTFPTANKTWMLDFASGNWTRLAYKYANSGELIRHHMNCIAFFKNKHFIGSWQEGLIYEYSLKLLTDAPLSDDNLSFYYDSRSHIAIYRERGIVAPSTNNKMARHNSIELIAEFGVGLDGVLPDVYEESLKRPKVWLERSTDHGRTWVNCGTRELGEIGKYNTRAIWRRLGLYRHASYRICQTDPVRCVWYGLEGSGSAVND